MKTTFLLLTLLLSFSNADTLKNAKEKWPFCNLDTETSGLVDNYQTISGRPLPQVTINCNLDYFAWRGSGSPPFHLKPTSTATYVLDVQEGRALGLYIGGGLEHGPSDWKDLMTAVKNFNMEEYTVAPFDGFELEITGFYFRSKDQNGINYVWVSDTTLEDVPLEKAIAEQTFVEFFNEEKMRDLLELQAQIFFGEDL